MEGDDRHERPPPGAAPQEQRDDHRIEQQARPRQHRPRERVPERLADDRPVDVGGEPRPERPPLSQSASNLATAAHT